MPLITTELSIIKCDRVQVGEGADAVCTMVQTIDSTNLSHSRVIERFVELGWRYDRFTERALCPACGHELA